MWSYNITVLLGEIDNLCDACLNLIWLGRWFILSKSQVKLLVHGDTDCLYDICPNLTYWTRRLTVSKSNLA